MIRAYDLPPGRRPRATFCIMAHRSAESIFGAATAPLKDDTGAVRLFATREEAQAEVDALTATLTTPNVRYTVAPWPPSSE